MATRATYRFASSNPQRNDGDITIYNHWDNYPAGAAEHFFQALVHSGEYGLLRAESFIRGNERAEITESHEIHGDTDYRYDIDVAEQTVKMWKRSDEDWDRYELQCFMDVKKFIVIHRRKEEAA